VNGGKIKLVIIGKPNISQMKYYLKCKSIAGPNIIFLDYIKHEELPSAYAAAKVHILPSWYETPGLTNLEAGIAGCNIVSTDRGSTKEYFKDMVEYCDPTSAGSIKNAVIKAFNKPKDTKLKQHILSNYTWDRVAKETLKGYQRVLDK
jgi:glycosyltransferase involved in cell wall biosynthesis